MISIINKRLELNCNSTSTHTRMLEGKLFEKENQLDVETKTLDTEGEQTPE